MEQLILTSYIKCKLVLTIATKLMVTPQKQQKLFIHMAVDKQHAMIGVTTIFNFQHIFPILIHWQIIIYTYMHALTRKLNLHAVDEFNVWFEISYCMNLWEKPYKNVINRCSNTISFIILYYQVVYYICMCTKY